MHRLAALSLLTRWWNLSTHSTFTWGGLKVSIVEIMLIMMYLYLCYLIKLCVRSKEYRSIITCRKKINNYVYIMYIYGMLTMCF